MGSLKPQEWRVETDEFLTPREQEHLLKLARSALETHVRDGAGLTPSDEELTDMLRMPAGVFSTLRVDGTRLRGCIGIPFPTMALAEAVCVSTVRSASVDPRFSPVAVEELDSISIEVSAFGRGERPDTCFHRIDTIEEIRIGRDGIYIEQDERRSGLLLPQVAVEQGWSAGRFAEAVCRKAGLAPDAWRKPDAKLYRFAAQVFSEPSPSSEALHE